LALIGFYLTVIIATKPTKKHEKLFWLLSGKKVYLIFFAIFKRLNIYRILSTLKMTERHAAQAPALREQHP